MGDIVALSHSEMESTVSQFIAKAQDLEGTMTQVKSQTESMATWQGLAKIKFDGVMSDWQNAMNSVHQAITDASNLLRDFHQQISDADTSATF